jgi:hypothetical protein
MLRGVGGEAYYVGCFLRLYFIKAASSLSDCGARRELESLPIWNAQTGGDFEDA